MKNFSESGDSKNLTLQNSSYEKKEYGKKFFEKAILFRESEVQKNGISVESDFSFCYSRALNGMFKQVVNLTPPKRMAPVALTEYFSKGDGRECASQDKSFIPLADSSELSIIIIDGNHPLVESNSKVAKNVDANYTLEYFQELRRKGYALIVDIPDVLQHTSVKIEYWCNLADLVILHYTRLPIPRKLEKKIMYWPGLPFSPLRDLNEIVEKTIDLVIPGSNYRHRNIYARYAMRKGLTINGRSESVGNESSTFRKYEDYRRFIESSRLTFTNGFNPRTGESIIVARAIEAMCSMSVLLYEDNSDINEFFQPYVHFVPIKSLPDFVEKARYLLNHEKERELIAASAYNKMNTTYSITNFWNEVTSRL